MESLWTYQWNESTRHKPRDHDALWPLFSPHKVLRLTLADGQNEASTGRQLVDQRHRHAGRSGRNHDDVIGRAGRPTELVALCGVHLDATVAGVPKVFTRHADQFLDQLDAYDLA